MSELRTSPPNDSATKKLHAPRSTKTSRAREVYLQKQAASTPNTSSATTPVVPKTVVTKTKPFKATPTPSYLGKKTTSKTNSVKSTTESISSKDSKGESKTASPEKLPVNSQGDVADDDFEIVQLTEVKESSNSPRSISPHPVVEPVVPLAEPEELQNDSQPITAKPSEEIKVVIQEPVKVDETPRPVIPSYVVVPGPPAVVIKPPAPQPQPQPDIAKIEPDKPLIALADIPKVQEVKINHFETTNIVALNPCDAVQQLQVPAIHDLETKLDERERDISKLEGSLRVATEELKQLEDEYSKRLNDLTNKLHESEQRLEKCIDECSQHKYWVDNTENQLSTMRLKFYESEQKLLAQEEDLKKLLRWSNIKNASIVTCAATAIAYYHVRK